MLKLVEIGSLLLERRVLKILLKLIYLFRLVKIRIEWKVVKFCYPYWIYMYEHDHHIVAILCMYNYLIRIRIRPTYLLHIVETTIWMRCPAKFTTGVVPWTFFLVEKVGWDLVCLKRYGTIRIPVCYKAVSAEQSPKFLQLFRGIGNVSVWAKYSALKCHLLHLIILSNGPNCETRHPRCLTIPIRQKVHVSSRSLE